MIGFIAGSMIALIYFLVIFITVVSQNLDKYKRSILVKFWKKLHLRDNFINFKKEEDQRVRFEINELKKNCEMIHKFKNELKAKRDELSKKLQTLQKQKMNDF